MSWIKGKKRNEENAQKFIRGLLTEFPARKLGRIINVSDRTIRRWATGEDNCKIDKLLELVEKLFPINQGNGPSLSKFVSEIEPNTNTKTVAVGEYTIRAANNDLEYLYSLFCS